MVTLSKNLRGDFEQLGRIARRMVRIVEGHQGGDPVGDSAGRLAQNALDLLDSVTPMSTLAEVDMAISLLNDTASQLNGVKLTSSGEFSRLRYDFGTVARNARQTFRLDIEGYTEAPSIPPPESPSPYVFTIDENVLDVLDQSDHPILDPGQVSSARQFLIETSQRHLASLTNSPQIQAELAVLVKALQHGGSVVALGMSAEAFSRVIRASREELGGTKMEVLQGLAEEIDRFVSQFQEWQNYVENAARTRYGEAEIAQAVAVLQGLAAKLDPSIATEKARDALKKASNFDPSTGRGRLGIFATIKNFVVAISKKLAEAAKDRVLDAVLTALGILALHALATPILAALPWAPPIVEFLKNLL